MEITELLTFIEHQAALMVDIATGGPRIDDKQPEYRDRRREIRTELRRLGLEDPNPFADLWAWHTHYRREFGTYAERRTYVGELYAPLRDALEHLAERTLGADLEPTATGWTAVDHRLSQLRERYATARTSEDHQAIGLLCRDVFRSLADATFDDELVPDGTDVPGPADAVARVGFVVDAHAPGQTNREIRKVIKSSFDLANKVQHDQDATPDQAALVAEATVTSVNLLRILILGAGEIAERNDGDDDDPRDEDYWDDV